VARRAVNLHSCAPASLCPRSPYSGGTPAARSSYWGAPLLRRLRRMLPLCAPSVPTNHEQTFAWHRLRLPLMILVTIFLAGALSGCAGAPVASSVPAVAVWDPEDVSPGAAGEQGIGEVLALRIVDAARARGLSVVERQKLLLAVEELRLGSSALADESTRLRLGRITGARQMVFGGYLAVGNRVRMDLRLVDVETGKVLRTASRTGPAGGIEALLDLCGKAASDLFP
jgi:TolB-like protein